MSYAINDTPPPPRCPRCRAHAQVHWVEITTACDPAPRVIAGYTHCVTQGCVDANGNNAVSWTPPSRDLNAASWLVVDS